MAEPRLDPVPLGAIARAVGAPAPAGGDPLVHDVHHDSRQVVPGSLFCCIPGQRTDGHDHAAAAVAAGAVALIGERPLGLGVPEIVVADARAAMAPAAAEVYHHPSRHLDVIGVTGTNGKTTVTHLVAAVLEAAGRPTAIIGTLSGTRTTPEAPELQRRLAGHVARGGRAAALEVSSHALVLHRVDAIRIAVAVFTNLGRDHLDFHQTMDAYFQAKAALFEPERSEHAVVSLDDPYGRLLRDAARIPTEGYSLDELADLRVGADEVRFTWAGQDVRVPLGGRFNAGNAIAAAHVARHLGVDPATIARGLAEVRPVPGRFEAVPTSRGVLAVVDYAHTPDALDAALSGAREIAGSDRVIVVFGCGGDRDRAKRPAMGEVAVRLADRVVLTSDNPRREDPMTIIDEIRTGMDDTTAVDIEPDRRRAIALALGAARPGDVVLVAGKGHETTQTIGDDDLPFTDRDVIAEETARIEAGS